MKICSKCGIEKPLSEFCNHKGRKLNKHYYCKQCTKDIYRINREHVRQQQKDYYQKNKEYFAKKAKKWAEKHQEERATYQKEYYQITKERDKKKRRESNKRWLKNNPHKNKEYLENKKSRKLKAKGEFRVEDIQRMAELQQHKCLACGKKKPLTVDHIIPLSQGGRNDILNLQMLCQSCNSSKHTSTQDYRSRKLKKQIFEQQELFE